MTNGASRLKEALRAGWTIPARRWQLSDSTKNCSLPTSKARDAAQAAKIATLKAGVAWSQELQNTLIERHRAESFLRGDQVIGASFAKLQQGGVTLSGFEGTGLISIQAPVPMQSIEMRLIGTGDRFGVNLEDCNRRVIKRGEYCTIVYSWGQGGPTGRSSMLLQFVNADSGLQVQIPIEIAPFAGGDNRPPRPVQTFVEPSSVVPVPDEVATPKAPVPEPAYVAPEVPVDYADPQPPNVDRFTIPERAVIRYVRNGKARLKIAFGPISDYQGDWRELDVTEGQSLVGGWKVTKIDSIQGVVVVIRGTETYEIRRNREFRDLDELATAFSRGL